MGLSFGDKQVFVLYDHEKVSNIRVYDFQDVVSSDAPKPTHEIKGNRDSIYNHVKWGPLNKTLLIATNDGQLLVHDLSSNKITKNEQVHQDEIFSMFYTHDFTMLVTCSKDGNANLIHPEKLTVVRSFPYGKPVRSAGISPLFEDPEN